MEPDSNNNISEKDEKKNIIITGTNNKYLIKRANRVPIELKKREIMNKYNLPPNFLEYNKQNEIIHDIYYKKNVEQDIHEKKILLQEIEKKIYSYKQQDLEKKIFNQNEFIDISIILRKLIECNMICYYCKCEVIVLYEHVREHCQWSVDRIDNSLGHNKDNLVISCLKCNIKRRKTNSDKFLFTKQLNLVKKD